MDIETPRHSDAFEFYFGLGGLRSYTEVSRKFSVSRTSIQKWAKAFNWIERCHIKDQLVAKEVSEKTTISTINLKAKRLKEISQIQQILDATIKTAIEALQNKSLKTRTAADLRALVAAKDMMIRTEQGLLGEDLEDKDIKIRVSVDADS